MQKYSLLIIVVFGLALCACDPSAQIAADKKRFPSISAGRPLGSACYSGDAASIKRRSMHPYGPTGGWYGKAPSADTSRTVEAGLANQLTMQSSMFIGYMQVKEPGYLISRSYDDVYGEVYCGWSPHKLRLLPKEKPVYVELNTCAVGDGGLDQVHEVCWIPDGAAHGVIIFSTAHPSSSKPLSATHLFSFDQLGAPGHFMFHEDIFINTFRAAIIEKNEKLADELIAKSLTLLKGLSGAVDGTTGAPIAAIDFNPGYFRLVHAAALGRTLGSSDAAEHLLVLKKLNPARCYDCKHAQLLLPIYDWLNKRLSGEEAKLPLELGNTMGVVGHDPRTIIPLLQGGTPIFGLASESDTFWRAVAKYLNGSCAETQALLKSFLDPSSIERLHGAYVFEIAAASTLLKRCGE